LFSHSEAAAKERYTNMIALRVPWFEKIKNIGYWRKGELN